MEAKDFYDLERLRGNTEYITSNDCPDYECMFYQQIFELMEGYSERKIKDLIDLGFSFNAYKK